jgi:hypothetical protein
MSDTKLAQMLLFVKQYSEKQNKMEIKQSKKGNFL